MIKELFDLKPYKYANYNQMEMLPYLTAHCGMKVAVYGAGYRGEAVIDYLRNEYGVKPDFVIDKAPQENTFFGIRLISACEFMKEQGRYFVIIAVGAYSCEPGVKEEIDDVLSGENVVVRMNGNYLAEPFRPGWRSYIKENMEEFEQTYDLLKDDISRETYIAYLKTFITGERFSGITFPEEYKYWGIDNEKERLFELDEADVWLNCGACHGDTIYNFLKCKNKCKKIIAVEADHKTFHLLQRNVSFLDRTLQEKIQLENLWIGADGGAMDDLFIDEGITLINMDIEGAELETLRSGENIIIKNRPILSVCVYHKKEDLIAIPQYIQSIVKDYVYVLRKYPSSYYWKYYSHITMQQNNELVIYAIPRERYLTI